jgi:hypothetical protein
MPNDHLNCTPLAWTVLLRATVEKHSRQAVLLQALPILLVQLKDLRRSNIIRHN